MQNNTVYRRKLLFTLSHNTRTREIDHLQILKRLKEIRYFLHKENLPCGTDKDLVGFKRDYTFLWIIRTSTAMLDKIRGGEKDKRTPASGHQPITDRDRNLPGEYSSGKCFL